jgi:hypothetical protein
MLARPPFEFHEQLDQFDAGGGEAVVGRLCVVMVLDQAFLLEVSKRASQGAGVNYIWTGLRYGVVQLGVPERPLPQGCQDGLVQLALGDVEDRFEVQRASPPRNERAIKRSLYRATQILGQPFVIASTCESSAFNRNYAIIAAYAGRAPPSRKSGASRTNGGCGGKTNGWWPTTEAG